MNHIAERLNQLTDMGFKTYTNRFELEVQDGKFIIDFLDVHCHSEKKWNTLMDKVKEKTSKKIVKNFAVNH